MRWMSLPSADSGVPSTSSQSACLKAELVTTSVFPSQRPIDRPMYRFWADGGEREGSSRICHLPWNSSNTNSIQDFDWKIWNGKFRSRCHCCPGGRHLAEALVNGLPFSEEMTRRTRTWAPAVVYGIGAPYTSFWMRGSSG